ncbi:MAG: TetR/AcrR family transcriptional regulator [Solirubrobacterales bacterium]
MDAGSAQTAQPRRRDWERNRETILAAASDCFMEFGGKASVGTIAERAGLGAATIYRHFPTRAELEQAVFDLRIDAYAVAIEQAQQTADDSAAFRATIQAIVGLQTRDRAFRDLLNEDVEVLLTSPGTQRFATAIFGALDRASKSGVLRDGVKNEDVMLLLVASEGIAQRVAAVSDSTLPRTVDLLVDALTGEQSQLTGEALTIEQLHAVSKP